MSIRSVRQLRGDQSDLLAAYRARNRGGAVPVSTAEIDVVATVAKVMIVVTLDGTYGAHLVVALQEFAGVPPSPQAASKPTLRAYPTPNHVVTDYAVDEFVLLQTARGALLAMKPG